MPNRKKKDWALRKSAQNTELIAKIWQCGDRCNCAQAFIEKDTNKPNITILMWESLFRNSFEKALEDLKKEAVRLLECHPDIYKNIKWPPELNL